MSSNSMNYSAILDFHGCWTFWKYLKIALSPPPPVINCFGKYVSLFAKVQSIFRQQVQRLNLVYFSKCFWKYISVFGEFQRICKHELNLDINLIKFPPVVGNPANSWILTWISLLCTGFAMLCLLRDRWCYQNGIFERFQRGVGGHFQYK